MTAGHSGALACCGNTSAVGQGGDTQWDRVVHSAQYRTLYLGTLFLVQHYEMQFQTTPYLLEAILLLIRQAKGAGKQKRQVNADSSTHPPVSIESPS